MAWYNSSWTYRQKITINAALVDEVFQVLPIAGSKLGSDFFDDAKSDGSDIRFTAADGTTELACHILSHDAGTDTGRYFVDVSSVSNISTDVDIYIYYGNAGASAYAANATYGADAVWDSHAGVYFPGMSLLDYTNQASGRALTAVGTPTTAASSLEGITDAVYNGTSQYHTYTGSMAVSDWPFTVEVLSLADADAGLPVPLALSNTGSLNNFAGVRYSWTTSGDPVTLVVRGNSGTEILANTSTGATLAVLQMISGTRDSDAGDSYAYLSGGNVGSSSSDPAALTSFNALAIGALRRSTISGYLDGQVAFAALSSSVRSANYMSTTNASWFNSSFISASAQETDTGGGTGGSFFFG